MRSSAFLRQHSLPSAAFMRRMCECSFRGSFFARFICFDSTTEVLFCSLSRTKGGFVDVASIAVPRVPVVSSKSQLDELAKVVADDMVDKKIFV
jgi:hypothetical protein